MAMGGKVGEQFTEINVTPLTDVFLVLLVIMILVAPLVNTSVLKVDPPTSHPVPTVKTEGPKLEVRVSKEGAVTVNGMRVLPPDSNHIQQLFQAEQTKAGNADIPLTVTSDADALQKHVVAVMDAASGAGIKHMQVMPLTTSK